MKNSKVMLTPHVHEVMTLAQRRAGIGRLDHAIGAFLCQVLEGEEPDPVSEEMLEGMSLFMRGQVEEKPPEQPEVKVKKRRKARPPGS